MIFCSNNKNSSLNIIGYLPKPVKYDQTHPDWHDEVCYLYRDSNVLLLGEDQAKCITKSVEIQNELPHDLSKVETLTKDMDKYIKKLILSSHVFDAEQKKLPVVKDPERPAWVFPRTYGITYERIW